MDNAINDLMTLGRICSDLESSALIMFEELQKTDDVILRRVITHHLKLWNTSVENPKRYMFGWAKMPEGTKEKSLDALNEFIQLAREVEEDSMKRIKNEKYYAACCTISDYIRNRKYELD